MSCYVAHKEHTVDRYLFHFLKVYFLLVIFHVESSKKSGCVLE